MKPPIINTQAGKVQGKWTTKGTIATFKGIPFAQPPVGDLRWKAPQPVDQWKGIKQTTKFSPMAWQQGLLINGFLDAIIHGQGWNKLRLFGIKSLLKIVPTPKQSEDCLYLNIKTPSIDPTAKLPVMIWIHGGDHQDGSASEPHYDGVAIPQKGIVLVTINYRLGLFGYFAHPDLQKESEHQVAGNYGTLDQIAALQWVQDNIAAFGGDPNNVTIFGESAGGESVAHMLTSPLAKGLFHKAILQSPANSEQFTYLSESFGYRESANNMSTQFTDNIGIKGDNPIEQMRKMPAKTLMQHLVQQEKLNAFYPVIDGYVLPKSPFETFFDGAQHPVPILLGSNADEGTLPYAMTPVPIMDYKHLELPDKQLSEQFYKDYEKEVDQLLNLYPGLEKRKPKAEQAILGDQLFGSKARWYAEYASKNGQPTYLYFFKRVPPSPSQTIGAFHAAELFFVHGTTSPIMTLTSADKKLSATMIAYWTNFAKTSQPKNDAQPNWEAFDPAHPKWLELDVDGVAMTTISREEKYQLLNGRTLRKIEALKKMRSAVV